MDKQAGLFFDIVRLAEWAGRAWNACGAAMHRQAVDGVWHEACPVCRGIKPGQGGWQDTAYGHRPGCELAALLRRIDTPAGKDPPPPNLFDDIRFMLEPGSMVTPDRPMELRILTESAFAGASRAYFQSSIGVDKPWVADKRYRVVAADGLQVTVVEEPDPAAKDAPPEGSAGGVRPRASGGGIEVVEFG